MPQLPYYNWNKIGSIEKVIQKHIEQKPVKEFLKKIRF